MAKQIEKLGLVDRTSLGEPGQSPFQWNELCVKYLESHSDCLDALAKQRDQWASERDAAITERTQMESQRDATLAELDAVRRERDDKEAENIQQQLEHAARQHAASVAANETLGNQSKAHAKQCATMQAAHAAWVTENNITHTTAASNLESALAEESAKLATAVKHNTTMTEAMKHQEICCVAAERERDELRIRIENVQSAQKAAEKCSMLAMAEIKAQAAAAAAAAAAKIVTITACQTSTCTFFGRAEKCGSTQSV